MGLILLDFAENVDLLFLKNEVSKMFTDFVIYIQDAAEEDKMTSLFHNPIFHQIMK